MRKRTFGWVLLCALFACGAPPALAGQTAHGPEGGRLFTCVPRMTIPTSWTRCEADADCVRVAWSCCDCFAGGISTAIHLRQLDGHAKRHRKLCPGYASPTDPARCTQLIACPSRVPVPGADPDFAAPFCGPRGRCVFGFRN